MFSPFFCGSFHHQVEEDDDIEPCSPSSSSPTRKSRKFSTCSRSKADTKNPYANRGLDKFSALLADLDDKRQKIYTQVGSQDISFVRFVYSGSNDCKPIVVKLRDNKHDKTNMEKNINKDKPTTTTTHNSSEYPIEASTNTVNGVEKSDQRAKKKSLTWDLKLEKWRRPSYYLPVIIVLILLFLAMFGRSFAILCTSIGWYLVPAIKVGNSSAKRPRKKKEYVRKLSENKISTSDGSSSPRSVITENSPRQHGHRKSW